MTTPTEPRCPHCGGPLDAQPSTEAQLRAWCVEHGHFISPDDAVHEDVAALLLDRAPGTLANWRANGGAGVPFFRAGRTGRVRYRLRDLAAHIDASRVND
ncbi:hypothetical protein [Reyranella sp.]|uniref:hypothetical protein n=1 Tax=Reyranella sp. TaxID=1929291 RepID=UPI003D14B46D